MYVCVCVCVCVCVRVRACVSVCVICVGGAGLSVDGLVCKVATPVLSVLLLHLFVNALSH